MWKSFDDDVETANPYLVQVGCAQASADAHLGLNGLTLLGTDAGQRVDLVQAHVPADNQIMKDVPDLRIAGSTNIRERLSQRQTALQPSNAAITQRSPEPWLYWTLRLAIAAMFFGHGAFGIITRPDWLPYFAVVGIPDWLGWRLEPLIGTMDITLGFITVLSPRRGVLVWTIFWAVVTALMRPLAGEGIWEFLTRAGNVGVPLAMLYMVGWRSTFSGLWRDQAFTRPLEQLNTDRLAWLLRITTAILLFGNGGLGFTHKASWITYFGAIGIGPETVQSASLMQWVGGFEMVLALAVLVKPFRGLLLAVFTWKVGTELLRLPAGEKFWEVPEQGVTFAAPLGLFFLKQWMVRNGRRAAEPVQSDATGTPSPVSAAA